MSVPFKINIPQETLDELRRRLAATRWPDQIDNDKWEIGTNEAYLQQLCRHWQQDFDWPAQEAYLNSFDHFRSTVDGVGLHFIHQRGTGVNTIPLLLTHGWPDSFVRFLKLIRLLTRADERGLAFDVVVPSIPGYGFSDIPTENGMNPKRIAGLFAALMQQLGYEKFVAHGGDWGTSITEQIALYHDELLLGIHLTDIPFHHAMMPVKDPSHAEQKHLDHTKTWQQKEGAYAMIQSTKPQTLAYGLNDSPAGLAAWIVEKFQRWTDQEDNVEDAVSREELLTNLTIYWATQTINSSCRLYYEAITSIMQAMYNPLVKLNPFDKTGRKSSVPAAFAMFPKDISSPPQEFAERFFTVRRWTEMDKGGHFAAMEQPELLANDIRAFVHELGMD